VSCASCEIFRLIIRLIEEECGNATLLTVSAMALAAFDVLPAKPKPCLGNEPRPFVDKIETPPLTPYHEAAEACALPSDTIIVRLSVLATTPAAL
jgi:hypothetical protein